MAWWTKLFGGSAGVRRVAYYDEGLELLGESKFHEALTSFRLALKESPGDTVVLQQIAIAYTRIGMTEEAVQTYRHVLQKTPEAAGAHYGLAFLLVRSGQEPAAIPHLRAFLENAPVGQEAGDHVSHARDMLAKLTGEGGGDTGDGGGEGGAAPVSDGPRHTQDDLF